MKGTTDLRNRAHPMSERELAVALLRYRDRQERDAARMAYAQTRGPFEATPNPGNGLYLGDDDDAPASGGETAAIIGVFVCALLLLAGLAYLVYLGMHGAPWTR